MFKSNQNVKKFLSQIWITSQSFGSSSVKSSWKPKPIEINKPDEKDDVEQYLEIYKSRKGISSDALNLAPEKVFFSDYFSVKGFKQFKNIFKQRILVTDQRFIDQRVDILGFDLAAAHFVVHRGGRVRFKGHDEWVERDEDYEYSLPRVYEEDYLVEELDVSGLPIIYDGFQNLENLRHLKTLIASGCPYIDDWCMDRICGQFSPTLEHLDISHCTSITDRGLESIGRLRSLSHLNVTGLDGLPNLNLVCLLLEDAIPSLKKIEGFSL